MRILYLKSELDKSKLVQKKVKVTRKDGTTFYRKQWVVKSVDNLEQQLSQDELKWGEHCRDYLSNTDSDEQIRAKNPNIPFPDKINASQEEIDFANNAVREYNAKAQYGDPSTYVKKYKGISSSEYRRLKKASLPEDVPEEVRKVYNSAVNAERDISRVLDRITEETGGILYGKDFRIKEGDSFWRKIQKEHKRINSDSKSKEYSLEEVASSNTDTIRYTNISQPDDLVKNFEKTKETLEKSGCKLVRLHNLFTDSRIGMNCLECIFQHPSGQKFELWFHTPETKHVQDNGGHKVYEALRVMDNKEDQKKCEQIIIEMNYKCKFPKGIEKIQNINLEENFNLTKYKFYDKIRLNHRDV